MRIAVMGAGGIGGYVGGRLAACGADVHLVARGAHLAAMKLNGLDIESPFGNAHVNSIHATDRPADIGPVDIVLFTVKLYDGEEAAAALAPLIAPHTRVVTLQNGIDSVDMIARHIPRVQVVGGVTYLIAEIASPGRIAAKNGPNHAIVDEHGGDPAIAAFSALCGRAQGFELRLTQHLDGAVWGKFVNLCSYSGATSLLRSTIGQIVAHPEAYAFAVQLLDEGLAIAQARKIELPEDYRENTLRFWRSIAPNSRSSMANDLEHGRRMELRWLSGRMHALGHELGVPTPAHSAVYRGLVLHMNGRMGT